MERPKSGDQTPVRYTTRREFLSAGGIMLSCLVAGQTLMMTPGEAFAADVPLVVLSDLEATTLAAVADVIVPGARRAGVVHFVDKQLSLELDQSLLMLKYLGEPAPFDEFYKSGLAALAQLSQDAYGKPWDELDSTESVELVRRVVANDVGDWSAPPAPFVYFVLRADACDVVYGTEEGFSKIEMPYMAHIKPSYNWKS